MKLEVEAGLILLVLALAGGAGFVVTHGASRPERATAASRDFQRLVGGLGLGPALDLARCAPAFDPRVGATCPERVGPIPGGDVFSLDHATAVLPP